MALGIPKIIQGRLTNPHPVDLQAAQMCLPFSVALAAKVALSPGGMPALGVADYEAGLKDQSLHDLEERTTIALDDEVEAASNELSTAARVSVTLRDGRTLSKLVPAPKGSPSQPFTGAEHEARFTQELSSRVPEKVCAEIVRDVARPRPARSALARGCVERSPPAITRFENSLISSGNAPSFSYFADAGNAGNFSMSRASCWMMTLALRLSAIFLMRSIDATVSARS